VYNLRNVVRCAHDVYVDITAVLREELWAGQTTQAVTDFLKAAGMSGMYVEKVGAWKRDRVPSLEQLAEIEHAHGLPRGWILWRAGYIDAEALVARGNTPPAAISIDTPTLAELAAQLAELRAGFVKITKQLKPR
jgi:hypothetical protein